MLMSFAISQHYPDWTLVVNEHLIHEHFGWTLTLSLTLQSGEGGAALASKEAEAVEANTAQAHPKGESPRYSYVMP